jgi:hypothetical protein
LVLQHFDIPTYIHLLQNFILLLACKTIPGLDFVVLMAMLSHTKLQFVAKMRTSRIFNSDCPTSLVTSTSLCKAKNWRFKVLKLNCMKQIFTYIMSNWHPTYTYFNQPSKGVLFLGVCGWSLMQPVTSVFKDSLCWSFMVFHFGKYSNCHFQDECILGMFRKPTVQAVGGKCNVKNWLEEQRSGMLSNWKQICGRKKVMKQF